MFRNLTQTLHLTHLHIMGSLSALLLAYHVGMGPHLLTGIFSSMATMMCLKKGFNTAKLSASELSSKLILTKDLYFSPDCRLRVDSTDGKKLVVENLLLNGEWECLHKFKFINPLSSSSVLPESNEYNHNNSLGC